MEWRREIVEELEWKLITHYPVIKEMFHFFMKGAALLFINLSIHSINSNKKSFIFIDSIHFFLEWKEWMKWKYIITVSLYVRTFKHKLINWWFVNEWTNMKFISVAERAETYKAAAVNPSTLFFSLWEWEKKWSWWSCCFAAQENEWATRK